VSGSDGTARQNLRKLGFKLSQRDIDLIAAGFQRRVNTLPIAWRPLLEAYAERKAEIHVHFKTHYPPIRWQNSAEKRDFCATFQWPREPLFDDLKAEVLRYAESRITPADSGEADWDEDESWMPVLVPIPHFVQDFELVALGTTLPTTIGLQRIEVCEEPWVYAPKVVTADRFPIVSRERGREGGASPLPPVGARYWVRGQARILDRQCPDEIVESAAQIIDRVANEETELCWRLLQARGIDGPLRLSEAVKVGLGFNFVSIARDVSAESLLERADVYIRVPNAVQAGYEG